MDPGLDGCLVVLLQERDGAPDQVEKGKCISRYSYDKVRSSKGRLSNAILGAFD